MTGGAISNLGHEFAWSNDWVEAQSDEFRESLKAALGKLSPRIAQVFQLYAVEGLPNREVCAQMEISESNLWAMLHRGRKQLRGLLTAWKGV